MRGGTASEKITKKDSKEKKRRGGRKGLKHKTLLLQITSSESRGWEQKKRKRWKKPGRTDGAGEPGKKGEKRNEIASKPP